YASIGRRLAPRRSRRRPRRGSPVTPRLALRSRESGARGSAPQARSAAPKHYKVPPQIGTVILGRAPQARSAAPKHYTPPPLIGTFILGRAPQARSAAPKHYTTPPLIGT